MLALQPAAVAGRDSDTMEGKAIMKRVCTFAMGGNQCDGAVRGQPTPMCPDDCEFLTRTFVAEVIEGEPIPVEAGAELVDWKDKYAALKQEHFELEANHWELGVYYDANLHDMRLYLDSLLDLAARFEEVCAGPAEAPPCPGEGWYWVRGHWRSRRVACQGIPDTSTEICRAEAGDSKDTAEGDIAVLGASGDARGASCDEAPARIKGE